MTPDVMFQRRDIQIPDQYRPFCGVFLKIPLGFSQKIKLMGEFWVLSPVWQIAPRRDIKIMNDQRPAGCINCGTEVPTVIFLAPVRRVFLQSERQARIDRDTIIAFHATL